MDPEVLGSATASLPSQSDPRLLVGFDLADDAGVVRLDAERALVQTVDFFTPIVDDPWSFGAIAAANALSDVYAMGGEPLSALNILCWNESLPTDALNQVLAGGLAKVREAGAVLAGGHSVSDPEPKFGLAVTGVIHPDRVWKNAGAQPGDALVLTKPLGTGIATTALKRQVCPKDVEEAAVTAMLTLNRGGRDAAHGRDVHAATDITGFGLAGHAFEMAQGSGVRLRFDVAALPMLPGVLALVKDGHLTRGETSNRAYVGDALQFEGVDEARQSVIVDPQTSGGLLMALPPDQAAAVATASGGVVVGSVEAGDVAVVFAG